MGVRGQWPIQDESGPMNCGLDVEERLGLAEVVAHPQHPVRGIGVTEDGFALVSQFRDEEPRPGRADVQGVGDLSGRQAALAGRKRLQQALFLGHFLSHSVAPLMG